MTKQKTGPGRTTQKKAKDPYEDLYVSTFADMIATKEPVEDDLVLCLDSRLASERDKAVKRYEAVKGRTDLIMARVEAGADGLDRMLAEAQEQLDQAEAEAEEAKRAAAAASVKIVMRAIGSERMDELIKLHAPSAAQQRDYQERLRRQGMPTKSSFLEYNPKTLPQALTAACVVSPQITEAEAREWWSDDNWGQGELGSLLAALWNVNQAVPH